MTVKTHQVPLAPLNAQQVRDALLRLPQVLERIPISRSAFWAGVKEGRYPAGIKLSARTTVWRASDIDALISSLGR